MALPRGAHHKLAEPFKKRIEQLEARMTQLEAENVLLRSQLENSVLELR
mgnify:CR=1 FL=1